MPTTVIYEAGSAADTNPATLPTDATDSQGQAWAIADGLGADGRYAARKATSAAVRQADHTNALAGLAVARAEIQEYYQEYQVHEPALTGTCSLLVAAPRMAAYGGGLDLAWAGNCRAYALTCDGAILNRHTRDHTAPDLPTVLTATTTAGTVRQGHIPPGFDLVLLCTDGVYATLGDAALHTILDAGRHTVPVAIAHRILDAVRATGLTDSASALVLAPRRDAVPRRPAALAGAGAADL